MFGVNIKTLVGILLLFAGFALLVNLILALVTPLVQSNPIGLLILGVILIVAGVQISNKKLK